MSEEYLGDCVHCGRTLTCEAGYAKVAGGKVCHPRKPDGPDCYHLITVYGEERGQRLPKMQWSEQEEADLEELRRALDVAEGMEVTKADLLGHILQLTYERRLLGNARQVLDQVAESSWAKGGVARDAATVSQRIVDEIGHPPTDEPALGPGLRERIRELEEYQERAEAKIRELAKERLDLLDQISINKKHYQRRTETLETARDRSKQQLDDVVNEVFTITSAYDLPEDRDEAGNAHLYALGRSAGLKDAYFAVLRGLGVFDPNHNPYVLVARLEDLRLLRLAINDPGAYTEREEIHEGEYESVANWAARAVQIALREGRGGR